MIAIRTEEGSFARRGVAVSGPGRVGVRELAARGVVFEDYDFPALTTIDHVASTPGIGKSAWFKDPDGNTLALFQPE